ncbi:MAG TPA: TIGR02453 family protein [Parabacteroides sp.]|nr:TIGR02453 family protein [Parabacteroides sp.]
MKDIIQFLAALKQNNDRGWFQKHKTEYIAAQGAFNAFVEKLIAGIVSFDDSVSGVNVKDCIYRIYRDTRFSADKSPYKTHMGAFVCPGGRKSDYSGYYFQVGPEESGYPEGNMLATGNYRLDSKVMHILREDICMDAEDFEQRLKQASLFKLDDTDMLKRVPNGFERNAPYSGYLMYKAYCLVYSPGKSFMTGDDLLERTLGAFRSTKPFLQYLNRAIAYSKE